MLAAAIIGLVILVVVGSAGKRLLDYKGVTPLAWLVLLLAALPPIWVGNQVMNPGMSVGEAEIYREGDKVSLNIPEGYSIMATAQLSEEDKDPKANKTAWTLAIQGEGWQQAASGTFARKSSSGPDVDVFDGKGVSDSTRRRSGRFGEDLQERIDTVGHGTAEITWKTRSGEAAESVWLEVVHSPPDKALVYAIAAAISLLAIFVEARYGLERLAGDVGLLAWWGVFLRDGVTPLDDFQGIARAMLPAALIGWGAVGGLAWLGTKALNRDPAPDPNVVAPPPDSTAGAGAAPEPRAKGRTRVRTERAAPPPPDEST